MLIELKQPNNPLSINEGNVMHWAQRKRRLDPWRVSLIKAIEDLDFTDVKDKHCDVQVSLWFRTKHRRDPHNYTGTVVKVIIDTLVRSGVWPDDIPEYVRVLDPIILEPDSGHRAHYCLIELTESDA
jgi:hypothetical protein